MSAESEGSREVVYIEEELHESYQRLTAGKDPFQSPFPSMKDLFMWAACLGARRGIRRPLSSKVTVFRWGQFDSDRDVPLLQAIALKAKKDPQVISNQNEVLTIAEEYANAGMRQLLDKIEARAGQPLWNLLDFVVSECAQDQSSVL